MSTGPHVGLLLLKPGVDPEPLGTDELSHRLLGELRGSLDAQLPSPIDEYLQGLAPRAPAHLDAQIVDGQGLAHRRGPSEDHTSTGSSRVWL